MNWQPTTIDTARLRLRPITLDDVDAIFAACADPALSEFTAFEPHHTRAASESFVQAVVFPSYEQGIPDPIAIAWRDAPQTLIGCIGGRPTETKCNRAIEIGYWVARPLQGQGVATEAVRGVLEDARFLV
jgi:RimJ/RimL family protein N-acetyltransferase